MFAFAAHAASAKPTPARSNGPVPTGPMVPTGGRNREAIAARETRIAVRLRTVEHACHTAIEGGAVSGPPEPARTSRSEQTADREIELD